MTATSHNQSKVYKLKNHITLNFHCVFNDAFLKAIKEFFPTKIKKYSLLPSFASSCVEIIFAEHYGLISAYFCFISLRFNSIAFVFVTFPRSFHFQFTVNHHNKPAKKKQKCEAEWWKLSDRGINNKPLRHWSSFPALFLAVFRANFVIDFDFLVCGSFLIFFMRDQVMIRDLWSIALGRQTLMWPKKHSFFDRLLKLLFPLLLEFSVFLFVILFDS